MRGFTRGYIEMVIQPESDALRTVQLKDGKLR